MARWERPCQRDTDSPCCNFCRRRTGQQVPYGVRRIVFSGVLCSCVVVVVRTLAGVGGAGHPSCVCGRIPSLDTPRELFTSLTRGVQAGVRERGGGRGGGAGPAGVGGETLFRCWVYRYRSRHLAADVADGAFVRVILATPRLAGDGEDSTALAAVASLCGAVNCVVAGAHACVRVEGATTRSWVSCAH